MQNKEMMNRHMKYEDKNEFINVFIYYIKIISI